VTPFSILNDEHNLVQVVLDRAVLAGDRVCCHPLVNDKTTSIATGDLLRFFEWMGHVPHVVDL
jgi:Ala-tRNA(Pro) deacylase